MSNTLDIKIQGREFHVACAPDERESLLETVAFLDAKMAEISQQTRSTGERLAVMTALNLAHELLSIKNPSSSFDTPEWQRRIQSIEARVDKAITEQQQDGLF